MSKLPLYSILRLVVYKVAINLLEYVYIYMYNDDKSHILGGSKMKCNDEIF
jgi:hypothetical protein